MKAVLGFVLISLVFAICSAEITGCDYEDTVDLGNAQSFENGSFLYENILIPADQIDVYDYEEIYNGVRVYTAPHMRGCLCKNRNCIKFCCEPAKEDVLPDARECGTIEGSEKMKFDMHVNVRFENGSSGRADATKDFIVIQGVPCASDVISDADNNVLSKWEVFENGSLYRSVDRVVVSKRDYCLLSDATKSKNLFVLVPLECEKYMPLTTSEIINDISKAISVPFLVLTLLIYAFLPELQNLHGKCFMSYLSALAIFYTIFTVIEFKREAIDDTIECAILGYVGYFFALSVWFWLNIISFDMWLSFRRSVPQRTSQDKRFIAYSAYAWGVPLCFTLILVGLDNSKVSIYYRPGVPDGCWCDTYKWSAVGYYTGINLAIVLVDITFLALTFYKIVAMQREINRVITKGDSSRSDKLHQDKNSFGLFVRLFLVMGITWIFEAMEIMHTLFNPNQRNPLYYVTDFLNAIIGVVIFICFVLNRKVLGLIKKRIQPRSGMTDSSLREEEVMLDGTDAQKPTITRRN